LPLLFVPSFVSYGSAKYYLNWFTIRKVIAKITRSSATAEIPHDADVEAHSLSL